MGHTAIDITSKRFGRWTVIDQAPKSNGVDTAPALWNVVCDCGTKAVRNGSKLRRGDTKSCGCSLVGPQPKRVGKYSREKHHAWKGGRQTDKKGYVWLSISQVVDWYPHAKQIDGTKRRKMLEHRAVMSNHLKRALFDDETVHHRNGNRSDNRLENLELKAGKHGPGQSIEDQITWAKEILRRYT